MEGTLSIVGLIAIPLMITSVVVILRNVSKDRGNKVIATGFIMITLLYVIRTISLIFGVALINSASINTVVTAMYTVLVFILYPLGALFPRFLGGWRVSMLLFPLYAVLITLYVSSLAGITYPDFITMEFLSSGELTSFHFVFRSIVLLLSSIFAILPAILAYRMHAPKKVKVYSTFCLVLPLVGIALFLFPQYYFYIYNTNVLWTVCFMLATAYYVKNIEPDRVVATPAHSAMAEPEAEFEIGSVAESVAETEVETEPVEYPRISAADDRLWGEITKLMEEDEIWRDPLLKLDQLSHRVGSNRTTISALIHARGDSSFSCYLAKYRIAAFCDIVRSRPIDSIAAQFNEVGFHTQSAALKHFRRIHNMTPREYIAKYYKPES